MQSTFTVTHCAQEGVPVRGLVQIIEILDGLPLIGGEDYSDYIIVERHDPPPPARAFGEGTESEVHYMQARPLRAPRYGGVFVVEFRDGSEGRHYASHVEAGLPLHSLFASYLRADGAWRTMAVWRDISIHFDDLSHARSRAERPALEGSEEEWEQADWEKKDAEFFEKWKKMQ